MKNVIMTGATGMIGSLVLKHLLQSDEIESVTCFLRRKTGIESNKLIEIINKDFENYDDLDEHFKRKDICYYCLGVYTGTVKRDLFRKITVDYTASFSNKLKEHSPECTFCFLSGAGADRKEKSWVAFSKDKGIAENALIKLKFEQLYIVRPAYIYPVEQRKAPTKSYAFMRKVYPLMNKCYSKGVITSTVLAHAMFRLGLKGGKKVTYENKELKQFEEEQTELIKKEIEKKKRKKRKEKKSKKKQEKEKENENEKENEIEDEIEKVDENEKEEKEEEEKKEIKKKKKKKN
ncbi:oxidoreductase htatip2 [Anaeramoeba flamelloides]|uniref:Oxidoreductase htatip2 n=1 Tax=Anaeramoeba flamelloides TaxID=1746091 RepID=A0AAV7Z6Y7_9EUKA|nr:oxidoreductase htatip2 [Anaeramoeba flamelloides]